MKPSNPPDTIEKFSIHIPDNDIEDLQERIRKTRWPNEENPGWGFGTDYRYLKEITEYWVKEFDWKKVESHINSFPNYRTVIGGYTVHFLHIPGPRKNAVPLLITHGWPGSFLEMLKLIPLLKNDFHLVIPSVIGFGFSVDNENRSIDYGVVAEIWHQLMMRLGYQQYGLQAGDLGAGISIKIAQKFPDHMVGMHLNYISDSYRPYDDGENGPETKAYKSYLEQWNKKEGAYALIQSTKPLSLAYGLNDSPIGLCAWILEKFNAWSDHNGNIENSFSKDELLANISLYWFTHTIYSSMKIYHGISLNPLIFKEKDFVSIPVGFARFPKEIPTPPRQYMEKGMNIVHWTVMPRGGHFAAMEQPELLAADIQSFFGNILW